MEVGSGVASCRQFHPGAPSLKPCMARGALGTVSRRWHCGSAARVRWWLPYSPNVSSVCFKGVDVGAALVGSPACRVWGGLCVAVGAVWPRAGRCGPWLPAVG